MPGPKLPPLVALRWLDAHAAGSTTAFEVHELPHRAAEITTYGLLLRDDAEGVSIACEDAGAGTFRGVTFVPRSLVLTCIPVIPTRASRKKHAPATGKPAG